MFKILTWRRDLLQVYKEDGAEGCCVSEDEHCEYSGACWFCD